MLSSPVVCKDKPDPESEIPTLLLVGSARIHPVMLAKLAAMEAAGTIRIVYHSLEYVEPRKVDVMTWYDEASAFTFKALDRAVIPRNERKPKPYYRTKERY